MAEGNGSSDSGPELLLSDTDTLRRWRAQLAAAIPSDAGTISALAGVASLLIDREILHPGRIKRDREAAKAHAKHMHTQTIESINQKYDAEVAALPPADTKAVAAVNAKREHELKVLEYAEKRRELQAKQLAELEEFRKKQSEELAKVDAPAASPAPSGPPPGGRSKTA